METDLVYYGEHKPIFDELGVRVSEGEFGLACEFTVEAAKAYQLLHIFLHELGHHEYRITKGQKHGKDRHGSEKYAEDYAIRWHRKLWKRYCELFSFRPTRVSPDISMEKQV